MPQALKPLSQQAIPLREGGYIVLTVVNLVTAGGSDTLELDGAPVGIAKFFSLVAGGTDPVNANAVGAPTQAGGVGTDATWTVTIGDSTAGTLGKCLVVTRHTGNISMGEAI